MIDWKQRAQTLENEIISEETIWSDTWYKRDILREEVRCCIVKYMEEHGIFRKRYPLPIREGRWEITQGNTTSASHQGFTNRFCLDFELVDKDLNFHPSEGRDHKEDPEGNYSNGKTFYAMASGRVIYHFRDQSDPESDNMIIIKHRETPDSEYDGFRSIYLHNRDDGFLVGKNSLDLDYLSKKYEGEYYNTGIDVKVGDPIGLIGWTGTSYTHLHVSVKYKALDNVSVPFEFEDYWKLGEENRLIYVKDRWPQVRDRIAISPKELNDANV